MEHSDPPGVADVPDGAPAVTLPPFFAAVRRRHPDVDLVVLPPEPAEEPSLDDSAVAAVVAEVGAAASEIAGSPVEPRVGPGPRPGTVRVRARAVVSVDPDGVRALRDRLVADGWEVRRFGPGRLVGRRDGEQGLHLRASYAEPRGAVLVDVSSPTLPVGERARSLVGQ